MMNLNACSWRIIFAILLERNVFVFAHLALLLVLCACLTYSDSEESDFMMDFLIVSLHFHVLGGKYY